MLFHELLRHARKAVDLSVREASARSGISWTQIGNYESGKHRPPLERLEILCRLYELDFENVAEEYGFE